MLENTFCHIPGVGPKSERELWARGLHSWREVGSHESLPCSAKKAEMLKAQVQESAAHLAAGDPGYFYDRLQSNQHWRLFPHFRHSVAYLDIETTGLGAPGDYITTIALYDGRDIRHYVHGDNLLDFRDDIGRYQLIVSYNGKTFDAPFIRDYLGVSLTQAHIDLRYVLASLGYRGGLKSCEKQLGLDREDLADVDGFFAVLLWYDFYNHGNQKALETLLAYNIMDVVNLETLMVLAYNLKLEDTPFAGPRCGNLCLDLPVPPELPFTADRNTIEKLKRKHSYF